MSETDVQAPRARRREHVNQEPLVDATAYDYADAFEIDLPEAETSAPEQLFRAALGNASWTLRWVPFVHRHVLRLHLGPRSSRDHLLGWEIIRSDADVVHLEAAGPLIRGIIVGRRVSPATLVFTTFVSYTSRTAARVVWAITGPLHRRIAPYLLERGAETANQTPH